LALQLCSTSTIISREERRVKNRATIREVDLDLEASAGPRFVERDGLRYAGTHLLVDLWEGAGFDDIEHVRAALTEAAIATGATLLQVELHHFTPHNGVTGVAMLAESHISIHTWPEEDYAAVDIFVCGTCDPHRAIPVLRHAFKPARMQLAEHRRGLQP
jgi:S-adenosylmethionine decarboxylase